MSEAWAAKPDGDKDGTWEVGYTSSYQQLPVILGWGLTEEKAHLIAASPEMLEALHAVLNWFTPPNDSRTTFPVKQIVAAIDKAMGAAITTQPRR